jgi:hypothetical protein
MAWPEMFAIPLQGHRYLIYVPTAPAAFVANAPMVNALATLPSDINEPCLDKSAVAFLQRINVGHGNPAGEHRPGHGSITLVVATDAVDADALSAEMDEEMAERTIDIGIREAVNYGLSSLDLIYVGVGLREERNAVMCNSLRYARARAQASRLALTGWLETSEKSNGLPLSALQQADGVVVRLDNLPAAPESAPWKATVTSSLSRLDELHIHYVVLLLVSNRHIPMLAEYVSYICVHHRPSSLLIQPTHLRNSPDHASAQGRDFLKAYRDVCRVCELAACPVSMPGTDPSRPYQLCGSPAYARTVLPDGTVAGCCDRHLPARMQIDWSSSLKVTQKNREYCEGCFAQWDCQGPCTHGMSESMSFTGSEGCYVVREALRDRLLANIAKAGGIAWCGSPGRGVSDGA